MHVNQAIWHGENTRTIWEASHRCCITRKVIHKEVTAGGRCDFIVDSVTQLLKKLRKFNTALLRPGRVYICI